MNRYRPWLTVLALSLCATASAADSNRFAGTIEPGSNWIRVMFDNGTTGVSYWCHASDCEALTFQGQTRGLNKPYLYSGNSQDFDPGAIFNKPTQVKYMRLTSVPVFALIPYKDPLVSGSASAFKAILAPWTIDEIRFDDTGKQPVFMKSNVPGSSFANFDLTQTLSAGDVVVGEAEAVESGKPMPLGVPEMAAAGGCTPGSYDQSYPSSGHKKFHRAFAPIEYLMERAGVRAVDGTPVRAMVMSGSPAPNGQTFGSVADDVEKGNLTVAEDYALALHAQNVGAAKAYLAETGDPADSLTAVEQRFLGCLAGVAGDTHDLQKAVIAASGDPQDFVSSARQFIRGELKRFVDASDHMSHGHYPAWPALPSELNLDALDWSSQWSGIANDAKAWVDKRTMPPTTAFTLPGHGSGSAVANAPAIVKKPVAPPPSPDDNAAEDARKALGD